MGLGLKQQYLRTVYRRWPAADEPREGYTLLMPVPPDLPVFFHLAVDVCSRQDPAHLCETLVIPDRFDRSFRAVFESGAGRWPAGRMRLVEMGRVDRLTRRIVADEGGRIHWLQIVNGIAAARTTHALLHDADLFLLDHDFLSTHYEQCVSRGLDCMGLQTRWPMHKGLEHLMGPWQMIFSVPWARRRGPFELCPQHVDFPAPAAVRLWADSTMLAQYRTLREKLAVRDGPRRFIHFESVLWNYRRFQITRGPFEDGKFSLLLIRLLVDAYDPSRAAMQAVPSIEQLARGIERTDQSVTYLQPGTREQYPVFRGRVEPLISRGAVDDPVAQSLHDNLALFDRAFGWSAAGRPLETHAGAAK